MDCARPDVKTLFLQHAPVFELHVLPQLDLHSQMRLAATCRNLYQWLRGLPRRFWEVMLPLSAKGFARSLSLCLCNDEEAVLAVAKTAVIHISKFCQASWVDRAA